MLRTSATMSRGQLSCMSKSSTSSTRQPAGSLKNFESRRWTYSSHSSRQQKIVTHDLNKFHNSGGSSFGTVSDLSKWLMTKVPKGE